MKKEEEHGVTTVAVTLPKKYRGTEGRGERRTIQATHSITSVEDAWQTISVSFFGNFKLLAACTTQG